MKKRTGGNPKCSICQGRGKVRLRTGKNPEDFTMNPCSCVLRPIAKHYAERNMIARSVRKHKGTPE